MSKELHENLLSAWLRLSTGVRNDRLVQSMSFNEICVCNILYRSSNKEITASDICDKTGMLKSQVNKVLTDMENSGMISRISSREDKRKTLLMLTKQGEVKYLKEHENVMLIFNSLEKSMGAEKLKVSTEIFNELADAMSEIN